MEYSPGSNDPGEVACQKNEAHAARNVTPPENKRPARAPLSLFHPGRILDRRDASGVHVSIHKNNGERVRDESMGDKKRVAEWTGVAVTGAHVLRGNVRRLLSGKAVFLLA